MKRTFTMLLMLALLASTACCALAETGSEQTQTFKTDYYCLSVPADWEISTDDLEEDENYKELGMLYSQGDPGMVVEASLAYFEEMKDVILWDASEQELQEHIDTLLNDYADDKPEYVCLLEVGSIPFVIIKGVDEVGPYHYAETITNGYELMFFAYSEDDSMALSDEQYEQFINILSSFSPIM